jgi:glycerol-3-phosphate cytidylyltransferase
MWQRLHFDVVFKGDDWKGTAKGDRLEAGMASVGARVVYFPYTRDTSSTAIRQLLFGGTPPPEEPAAVTRSS